MLSFEEFMMSRKKGRSLQDSGSRSARSSSALLSGPRELAVLDSLKLLRRDKAISAPGTVKQPLETSSSSDSAGKAAPSRSTMAAADAPGVIEVNLELQEVRTEYQVALQTLRQENVSLSAQVRKLMVQQLQQEQGHLEEAKAAMHQQINDFQQQLQELQQEARINGVLYTSPAEPLLEPGDRAGGTAMSLAQQVSEMLPADSALQSQLSSLMEAIALDMQERKALAAQGQVLLSLVVETVSTEQLKEQQ
eukprot:gene10211-10372_t